ncbi:MAG: VanZ family protein [Butyribacter sp.]|nr:VanZ family protein [bacterium]MDY3854706.1 VanZ family protein [Butyribacter sp.]
MNKRAVNISSLVILLALLSFILEMCLYYFIPQHIVTVAVAVVISLALTHFFLETSLNYDYCFLHASFMTIASIGFCMVIYFLQPNQWIQYDYSLIALIIFNWLTPFIYCFLRDFADRGPRFDDYLFFFHGMSILFLVIYAIGIIKQFFVTPLLPPYDSLPFGAHNFIPFMATGNYLETALSQNESIHQMVVYILEMIVLAIPFGFYAKVYTRNFPFPARLAIYLGCPLAIELLQYVTGNGYGDIDDYSLTIIGTAIGIAIYHIVQAISYGLNKRNFLEDRTVTKNLIFHFEGTNTFDIR